MMLRPKSISTGLPRSLAKPSQAWAQPAPLQISLSSRRMRGARYRGQARTPSSFMTVPTPSRMLSSSARRCERPLSQTGLPFPAAGKGKPVSAAGPRKQA